MSAGTMTLYTKALEGLLQGAMGNLGTDDVSAVLLGTGYTPDLANDETWSDLSAHELTDTDYSQQALSTVALTGVTDGYKFTSADVSFGDPVTILDAKYMAFVRGTAGSLNGTDRLLSYMTLRADGGTITAFNDRLTIVTPANGWFTLTRA